MFNIKPGRNLYLSGTVDWQDLMALSLNIKTLVDQNKKEWMNLYITSYGGNAEAGFGIYDFIRKIARPKMQTVVVRRASSIAIVITMAGTHRVMLSSAVMNFHDIGEELAEVGVIARKDLKSALEVLNQKRDAYARIIARNSKLSPVDVKLLMDREETVDAKTALNFGLVHEIIR